MIPYVAVQVVDQVAYDSNVAIWLHYIFCVIDPLYLMYGGIYFIFRVSGLTLCVCV